MIRLAAFALVLLAWIPLLSLVHGDPPTESSPVPYDRMLQATVEVLVDDHLGGSGWIATPEGLALTAAHVTGGGDERIEVLWGGRRLEAELVARDRGNDLALLRLPARAGGYPFLSPADAVPAPGTAVWLVGAPIYRHGVLLHGTIARADTTFEWYPKHKVYARVTHIAASVPRGVSGGPWCNMEGEVVALQSGTMTSENVPVGVGFIVPVEAVTRFVERGEDVTTPTLAAPFEEVWEQSKEVLARYPPQTEGVVVRRPVSGGPLAEARVSQWQVILAVDGQRVRYRDELLAYIRGRTPGEFVRLELLLPHGAGKRTLDVALGSL